MEEAIFSTTLGICADLIINVLESLYGPNCGRTIRKIMLGFYGVCNTKDMRQVAKDRYRQQAEVEYVLQARCGEICQESDTLWHRGWGHRLDCLEKQIWCAMGCCIKHSEEDFGRDLVTEVGGRVGEAADRRVERSRRFSLPDLKTPGMKHQTTHVWCYNAPRSPCS